MERRWKGARWRRRVSNKGKGCRAEEVGRRKAEDKIELKGEKWREENVEGR